MKLPVHHLELEFASIDFYETYLVCKIKAGVSVGIEKVVVLHKAYREHYGAKKYGYIFDRTIDFSINPLTYMECPYYPDVTAFAIVAPNPETKKMVAFEEKFSKMELKTFDTLTEAKRWMENINVLKGL